MTLYLVDGVNLALCQVLDQDQYRCRCQVRGYKNQYLLLVLGRLIGSSLVESFTNSYTLTDPNSANL